MWHYELYRILPVVAPICQQSHSSFNYSYQSKVRHKSFIQQVQQSSAVASVTRKNKLFILFCFDDVESSSLLIAYSGFRWKALPAAPRTYYFIYILCIYVYQYINIAFDSINYYGSGLTTQIVQIELNPAGFVAHAVQNFSTHFTCD